MKDYINDTFIRLTDEGRIKDAVEFCEMVAKKAPYVEFQCVALKNLAECHFFMTGDGEACREANLRGIQLMDEHPEIMDGTKHMSANLIKRMYSDFCEQFRAVAVSFEEYEEYCEKPLRVREQNAVERRGLKAVEQLKSQNAGWIENMFVLLDNYYPQSQWAKNAPAASQGACMAQLILLNRRSLRTKPLDVNFALQQYQNCIVALTNNLVSRANKHGATLVGGQIKFIIERASEIIEGFCDDRQADQPTVDACLKNLSNVHTKVMRDYGSDNNQKPGYIRLSSLKDSFDSDMKKIKKVKLQTVDTGKRKTTSSSDVKKTEEKPDSCWRGCALYLLIFLICFIVVYIIILLITGKLSLLFSGEMSFIEWLNTLFSGGFRVN